ncbi:MAG: hypothetical protein ACRDAQ_03210 [Cetobacterium sp.]
MKLDITTKHLRIVNLLKFVDGENCDFLESCLGFSKANLNNYLKEIHNVIPETVKTGKMDIIVKKILEEKDIYNLLLSRQTVSKEDRTFFLILKLLITSTLNLDSLTGMLGVSRRTLNGDLLNVKIELNIFDLNINSISGRGIFLEGEFLNVKRALCCYIYKYLVEEQYLPKIFIENFSDIINCSKINTTLEADIERLISEFNFDTFFYNRILLKSFYLSFLYFDSPNGGDMSTLEHTLKKIFNFETYFSKVFTEEEIPQFYDYLHNSIFRDIYFEEIGSFINILRICSGNFPEEKIYLADHIKVWKEVILNSLGRNVSSEELKLFDKFIYRIGYSSKQDHYLTIFELDFINLNINKDSIQKSIALYNEFKKHYWNISYSDVLMLFLMLNTVECVQKKDVVIVFRDIPKYVLINLKPKLEYKYNVNITNFVNIYSFNLFRKSNPVSRVGVFTELGLNPEKFEIIPMDLNI